MTNDGSPLNDWKIDFENCKWRWPVKTAEEEAVLAEVFQVAWCAGHSYAMVGQEDKE